MAVIGILGPLALDRIFGWGGMISAAAYFASGSCLAWVILDWIASLIRFPGRWWRLLISIALSLLMTCGLDHFRSDPPSPAYGIGLNEYSYAEGVPVPNHDFTWKKTYRIYTITISNPWSSREMRDVKIEISTPAVARRQKLTQQPLTDGAIVEEQPSAGVMLSDGTITQTTTEYINQVILRATSIRGGGKMVVELLMDFETHCSPFGSLWANYTYSTFFRGDKARIDRQELRLKDGVPREIEFRDMPPEHAGHGAMCMTADRMPAFHADGSVTLEDR